MIFRRVGNHDDLDGCCYARTAKCRTSCELTRPLILGTAALTELPKQLRADADCMADEACMAGKACVADEACLT